MDTRQAILERRSIRKFKRKNVPEYMLRELVRMGGTAASGMNLQPIKFVIVSSEKMSADVFEHTRWAGYLKGKGSPSFEERPAAFILMLGDLGIRESGFLLDAGAAAQNILVAACSMGLGTCWLGALDYDDICEIIGIPEGYKLISAIAVGYPDYESISEHSKGDIKYYLDDNGVLHVPKRNIDEIILKTC